MRMVLSKQVPDRAYVLLIAGQDTFHPEYRERRASLLSGYCHVAKVETPNLKDIIGIATEPADHTQRSEDFFYMDARQWDDAAQRETLEIKKNTGLMSRLTRFEYHDNEYPREAVPPQKRSNRNRRRNSLKKRRSLWKAG
jgi:hypothetical protein